MCAIRAITRRLAEKHVFHNPLSRLPSSSTGRSPRVSLVALFSFSMAFSRAPSVLLEPGGRLQDLIALHRHSTLSFTGPVEFPGPEIVVSGSSKLNLVDLIRRVAGFESEAEAMDCLDESGAKLNCEIVLSLIWELRGEWRLAFLAFKWGERCDFVDPRAFDLMVWVLGNHQKFNTAWCLIRDMYRSSIDTRKAMLIMIDRYAAASDASKAIRTFQIMDKFRLTPDEEAFHSLLHALCMNGNIEEAEEFMLVNKKLFPASTEGFNIILNGWCNVLVDVSEAKRVWRKMSEYCILPNAGSYKHMISCFSKVGNLFDSLRLFDEMRKRGFKPELEVYTSLFYVMTLEDCFSEALKLLEKMRETGLHPNTETYNSMIRPLCEAKKMEEARGLLATMISEKLDPTIDTFHAFLKAVGFEETLELLKRMKILDVGPTGDTFLLILEKFLSFKQPEYAMKIWSEMEHYEVLADSRHYLTLIQGLVMFGRLVKAKELYSEMTSKGFLGDPKLEKLLHQLEKGKQDKRPPKLRPLLPRKRIHLWKGNSRKWKKPSGQIQKERGIR